MPIGKEPTRAPLPRDVAIVGLGTAGAAAAIFLARAGHRVTLFERVPEPTAIGAGIMLQPTGQAVLRRLGLLDQILARGARVDSLRAEATTGRLLFDLHYATLRPDVYGVGLHRGVLFETLFAAVRQVPAKLELGVEIQGIQRARGDKRLLTDASGEARGPFDLVVVADGARSHLAAPDGPKKRVAHYPWGALWFVGHDEAQDNGPILRQVVRSTGRMVGLLPTGLGPGGASTPLVSLFYSLRVREFETWHQGFDNWKKEVASLAPRTAPVLDQIQRPSDVLFAAYHDVVMRPWHGEALVHLGDAAHATSPQLGQGANLALVDAMVLTDCLSASDSVGEALASYSRLRRQHLGFYQFLSRWLTPFFQSDHGVLGHLRDTFMPFVCRLPPIRRLMIQVMTGSVQGLLRAPLHLPAAGTSPIPPI